MEDSQRRQPDETEIRMSVFGWRELSDTLGLAAMRQKTGELR